MHARRRCLADEAWWPAPGNAALLAVSRALSACLTRCPPASRARRYSPTKPKPGVARKCSRQFPNTRLFASSSGFASAGPRARRRRSDAEVSPAHRRSAAGDAAAADEAYGGVDHDHGAVDDATLAAAMGGAPVGTRVWPPAKSLPPRIDQCLALALAPLCLRGVSADGDDDEGLGPKAYPLLVPDASASFDAVPVPASVPSFGPWPRGGRPPHGRRTRLEKSGEPSASAAMSGAWFGARLSFDDAGPEGPEGLRLSHDASFRVGLTSLPDGTLSGWIRDTVGELTLRGTCDPRGDGAVTIEGEVHRVRRAARGGPHVLAARKAAACGSAGGRLRRPSGASGRSGAGGDHAGGLPDVAGRQGQGGKQQGEFEQQGRRCGAGLKSFVESSAHHRRPGFIRNTQC